MKLHSGQLNQILRKSFDRTFSFFNNKQKSDKAHTMGSNDKPAPQHPMRRESDMLQQAGAQTSDKLLAALFEAVTTQGTNINKLTETVDGLKLVVDDIDTRLKKVTDDLVNHMNNEEKEKKTFSTELSQQLEGIDGKLKTLALIESAFVKDDTGQLDTHGHRNYHAEKIKDSNNRDQMIQGWKAKMVDRATTVILMLIGLGLFALIESKLNLKPTVPPTPVTTTITTPEMSEAQVELLAQTIKDIIEKPKHKKDQKQ